MQIGTRHAESVQKAPGVRKPTNLYPELVRRLLRRVLPARMFRRCIGRHEDESLYWWRRIAAHVAPGQAILDIGAFHGEYALAARDVNPTAEIYAFEPNPASLRVLRPACDRRSITVIEAAVSAKNGELPFVDCSDRSRILDLESPSDLQEEVLSVPAVTLNSWVTRNSIVTALIKIDVEGAEAGILRHGDQVLAQQRPVILCEILSDVAGREVRMVLPNWYRLYHIDENRGIQEESRLTRRRWRNKNWLLIPQDQEAAVLRMGRMAE
jgi:FkbM family methyltransferase